MAHLTVPELHLIRQEFEKADTNKDNLLSLQEFQTLLGSSLKPTLDLFSLFDKNSDGKVSFNELITALAVLTKGSPAEKLEFLFDYYDKDKDGVLTTNEIRTLLQHIKQDFSHTLGSGHEKEAQLEAEAIVKKLDVNGDGKITRAEWLAYSASDTILLKIFGLEDLLA